MSGATKRKKSTDEANGIPAKVNPDNVKIKDEITEIPRNNLQTKTLIPIGHKLFDHNLRTFKCQECSMHFANQHLLYHHRKRSHSSDQEKIKAQQESFGKFKCHLCTSQFSSASSLKSHHTRVHSNQALNFPLPLPPELRDSAFGKLKCELCSARFASDPALKSHISRMHSKSSIEKMVPIQSANGMINHFFIF